MQYPYSWLILLLVGCSRTEAKPLPKPVEAPAPSASSVPVEVPKTKNVLGTFQTLYDFKGSKYEGRAANISYGASKLNVVEILPGATFSFNQTFGPRTLESGFFQAPEIFFGEMVPGVGGGTCQVSSTLFAAAVLADLDVVERRPHSRPLRYIKPGLDATVAFPDPATCEKDRNLCSDLKLRNPYPFPVTIMAGTDLEGDKRKLVIWIEGEGSPPAVKVHWSFYQTSPFKQRFRKTNKFLGNWKKRIQSGSEGMEGTLVVQGGRNPRRIQSRYAPVDEIWDVGLGWDMTVTPWSTEP
jgi:vancomycin resistance protein YoaR